ncbi:hypothetical protein L7F22_032959 [Adiantum nelumboides]|nr:hypothetical protein [Adiantum nelumboides]
MALCCMLSEMVDAQADLTKCLTDTVSLLQACSTNDDTQCCSSLWQFVNSDGDCLCAAVEAGTLDSSKIYQAANLCHFTVPSPLASCHAEMVDAQADLTKCLTDTVSLLQACSTNDDTQCCSSLWQFVNSDGDCLCAAVEAGTLDSSKIYQAANLCHFTVPSSLASCHAGNFLNSKV